MHLPLSLFCELIFELMPGVILVSYHTHNTESHSTEVILNKCTNEQASGMSKTSFKSHLASPFSPWTLSEICKMGVLIVISHRDVRIKWDDTCKMCGGGQGRHRLWAGVRDEGACPHSRGTVQTSRARTSERWGYRQTKVGGSGGYRNTTFRKMVSVGPYQNLP